MTEQMNSTALHDLAGSVHDIANRRAGVMSTYEVANLELAHEQLNRFTASIERPVPTTNEPNVEPRTYEAGWDDGHIVGFDDGWGAGAKATREAHPPLPTREQINSAVGEVLFNVSNYPPSVSFRLLGQDIGPLRAKVTEAVLAILTADTATQEPRISATDAVQAWAEDALETGSAETRDAARDVLTIIAREND